MKQYHRLREDVIKAKATECDLWNFRVKELEHTVATFLRTIQMFDMEYRAAVPKYGNHTAHKAHTSSLRKQLVFLTQSEEQTCPHKLKDYLRYNLHLTCQKYNHNKGTD